jgi:Tfp pilus assembly protein PilF
VALLAAAAVSTVLDALTRGRTTAKARRGARSLDTDALLATLGFNKPSPAARLARYAAMAIALLGVTLVMYVVWLWAMAQPERGRQATAAAARPPAHVAAQAPLEARPIVAAVPPPSSAPARTGASDAQDDARSEHASVEHRAVLTPHRQRTAASGGPVADRSGAAPAAPHESPLAASTTGASASDFELAVYYQRSGEFEQSLARYQAVLQRDPLNVEAHNNLGLLYKDKGLLEDAAREFQRALNIDSRYVRAHNNLAVTLLQQGHADAAIAELTAALRIAPRSVDTLVNLALARKAAGQDADARALLVRALGVDPHSAAAHYNLAIEDETAGEAARALDHYRAFIQYAGPEYSSRLADVRTRIASLEKR